MIFGIIISHMQAKVKLLQGLDKSFFRSYNKRRTKSKCGKKVDFFTAKSAMVLHFIPLKEILFCDTMSSLSKLNE